MTIRTPPSLLPFTQQAAFGTRFSMSPVVGRLRKPSPEICLHLALAQVLASPRLGRARARHHAKDKFQAWIEVQVKTTSAFLAPSSSSSGARPPSDIGKTMATFSPAGAFFLALLRWQANIH